MFLRREAGRGRERAAASLMEQSQLQSSTRKAPAQAMPRARVPGCTNTSPALGGTPPCSAGLAQSTRRRECIKRADELENAARSNSKASPRGSSWRADSSAGLKRGCCVGDVWVSLLLESSHRSVQHLSQQNCTPTLALCQHSPLPTLLSPGLAQARGSAGADAGAPRPKSLRCK